MGHGNPVGDAARVEVLDGARTEADGAAVAEGAKGDCAADGEGARADGADGAAVAEGAKGDCAANGEEGARADGSLDAEGDGTADSEGDDAADAKADCATKHAETDGAADAEAHGAVAWLVAEEEVSANEALVEDNGGAEWSIGR